MSRTRLGFLQQPLTEDEKSLLCHRYLPRSRSLDNIALATELSKGIDSFIQENYGDPIYSIEQLEQRIIDGPLAAWKESLCTRFGYQPIYDEFRITVVEERHPNGRTLTWKPFPRLAQLFNGDFIEELFIKSSFVAESFINDYNQDYRYSERYRRYSLSKLNDLVDKYIDEQARQREIGGPTVFDHHEFISEIEDLLRGGY